MINFVAFYDLELRKVHWFLWNSDICDVFLNMNFETFEIRIKNNLLKFYFLAK